MIKAAVVGVLSSTVLGSEVCGSVGSVQFTRHATYPLSHTYLHDVALVLRLSLFVLMSHHI